VLSNVYPQNGGALFFHDQQTIATALQQAGYATSLVGKYMNQYYRLTPWPYVPPGWSDWRALKDSASGDVGYYDFTTVERPLGSTTTTEVFHGTSPADYQTSVLGATAVRFIKAVPAAQPLFLYITPYAPHEPSVPAPQDVGRCATLPSRRPVSFNEPNVTDQPAFVRALPLGTASVIAASDGARRAMCETLLGVDRMVDSIVTALGQTGRLANTYVMLLNDNGYQFGEHRLFERKGTLFEESVRMAFAIRGPGIARRIDRSHFVQMADLTPTLLDWAGIPAALPVDGVSLRPILANPSAPWRTELLLENLDPLPTNETATGLRDAFWSYHEYSNGDRALYDMRADSFQVTNQAGNPAYAAIVAQLAARLAALRSQ
jgi:arylsulfatase A-like enzyme